MLFFHLLSTASKFALKSCLLIRNIIPGWTLEIFSLNYYHFLHMYFHSTLYPCCLEHFIHNNINIQYLHKAGRNSDCLESNQWVWNGIHISDLQFNAPSVRPWYSNNELKFTWSSSLQSSLITAANQNKMNVNEN